MAQNNSFREVKKTVLVVVEGHTEKAFILHLMSVCNIKKNKIHVKIENAQGTDPRQIIDLTLRIKKYSQFDNTLIIMDSKPACPKDYLVKAEKNGIELFLSEPCIEGFLLKILGIDISGMGPGRCKKKFETDHLTSKQKLSATNYISILPYRELNNIRKTNGNLHRLMKFLE